MNWQEALLYGAIQGITEYLPISSSAHLILLPKFLGTEDPGLSFDIFLHLGTLFATLIYFWQDWLEVLRGFPKLRLQSSVSGSGAGSVTGSGAGGVSWFLIACATVPALVAGVALHSWVKDSLRENWIQASALAVAGVILVAVDRIRPRTRHLKELTLKDAMIFGVAQCFALIPGVSRSGSTITAGRFLGFDRGAAARFSFLMSAPITLAALIFDLRHWKDLMDSTVGVPALLVGGVSSFLFGMLAIGGLLRLLKKFGYMTFAVYRVGLAVVILVYLGF